MPQTVVVCFRVEPNTKLALVKEASKLGITLADYCQMKILAEGKSEDLGQAERTVKNESRRRGIKEGLTNSQVKSKCRKIGREVIKEMSESRWEFIEKKNAPKYRKKWFSRLDQILEEELK